jgi:uncharacterized oxidoreductase
MRMHGNTILITGGATGIGLSLAEGFIERDNEVIVCARTEENLRRANERLPALHTKRCDLSREDDRKELHEWVISCFPETNLLVNNAGIQRVIDFRKGLEDLNCHQRADGEDEIEINLRAYIHLAAAFVPDLMKRKEAAIVNVSSGLAFIPLVLTPVYCATKAGVHSFSVTLRYQLRNTPIRVFEIMPPTVDTNLDKGARAERGQQDRGIPPSVVAQESLARMEKDEYEIAIGGAENLRNASKTNFDEAFSNMSRSFR